MPRRLSAHDLSRFLDHLAQTGNLALAAARTRRSKSVIYKRRAADPAFATRCEAALTAFRTNLSSPLRPNPSPLEGEDDLRVQRERGEGSAPPASPRHSAKFKHLAAGELRLHTPRRGPPQLRRAQPGHLTPAGIAAFLRALSATGNIRLSAQSVGVAPSSVHARRRRDPAFAKEWDEALALACDRLELALIGRAADFMEGLETPAPAWEDSGLDPWRDDPALPHWPEPRIAPLTVDDALRILTHHRDKKRRAQAPYKRPPTFQELAPQMVRKANALKRKWREEE